MDLKKQHKISVIGLGYVGLPVAVSFGKAGFNVVAFDINQGRIDDLKRGKDVTNEVDVGDLNFANVLYTSNPEDLKRANFHIVTVPTPIDHVNRPDLTPLLDATQTIGKILKKGDVVVYESTVYPGTTEEECVPVLEDVSGLKYNQDFFVGYSPERINPGDKEHRFETITKIVSGSTHDTLKKIAAVYGCVVKSGIHQAPNIATAEAAKVIENVQRDLNIALINEIALICHRLGIDTNDVLNAAGTKWNFMKFQPGLVGGHCIGVDPYYLTHCAEKLGYHPEVILSGRRTNSKMPHFVASSIIKSLFKKGKKSCEVIVLGCTFKENVPDIRNTRVFEIIKELENYNIKVHVSDPHANFEEAYLESGLKLVSLDKLPKADAVLLAVPHKEYIHSGWSLISSLLKAEDGIVFDLKGVLDTAKCPAALSLWRL